MSENCMMCMGTGVLYHPGEMQHQPCSCSEKLCEGISGSEKDFQVVQGKQVKQGWIRAVKLSQFRLLVCGGRKFDEKSWMFTRLAEALSACNQLHVIHGGASGADTCAGTICAELGIPFTVYPADWQKHGSSAGFIRNERMLREGRPHAILPFPGGAGTGHMIKLAHEAGIHHVQPGQQITVQSLYN